MKRLFQRLFGGGRMSTPEPASAPTPEPQKTPALDLSSLIEAAKALNLRKERATILLYLDRSGSTNQYPNKLWSDGTMQLLTSMVAALAEAFGTWRKAQLRFFHVNVVKPLWPEDGHINRHNAHQILAKNSKVNFGGTRFTPVLLDMVRQALLLDAQTRIMDPDELDAQELLINAMDDSDLLEFITPEIDENDKELLRPLLKLPQPIFGIMATDGLPTEKLDQLLKVLRWMSQIGIYVMLVGTGNNHFKTLKGMDEAGEALWLQKGLRPLWDNADFADLKDLTNGIHRVPDGPAVIELVVNPFMDKAYTACRVLRLIA